jgi:hypothetical protein
MRRIILFLFACLFAVGSACAAGAEAEKKAAGPPEVLNSYSYWRSFVMMRPVVTAEKAEGAAIPEGEPRSDAPPADWMKPDFDDRDWRRAPGPIRPGHGQARGSGGPQEVSLICLRGRFTVPDPGKVESLSLSAAYRGGIVVYLNGEEVARGHLPDGELTPETLAEEYPPEAYSKEDGTTGLGRSRKPSEEEKRRLGLRVRQLKNVAVPGKLLKKGVNVLAMEVHSTVVHPIAGKIKQGWKYRWSTSGVWDVKLTASPGGSVEPNIERPKGVRVWNASPIEDLYDMDYGDPNEPLRPIELIGARNGAWTGQVVVGSDAPLKGVSAEMAALAGADGAAIPVESTVLRYPVPNGEGRLSGGRYRALYRADRFDGLADAPPAEVPVCQKKIRRHYTGPMPVFGAAQPVRVTVKVPADAAPGDYEGALTVKAEGLEPVKVPVKIKVIDWQVPDRKDFVTHMGMIQSAETAAIYYKVPQWSDEHWAHIDRSFKVMAEVGADSVFIPLIMRHHLGKEGMVRWIKGEGDTYTYDFTLFDRYIDIALKHIEKPEVVCFYIWDRNYYTNSRYNRKKKNTVKRTAPVPLLDKESGEITELKSPLFATEESVTFWKPVLDECRKKLLEKGCPEKALMIGKACDSVPMKEEVAMFKKAAPWARWVKHAHGASSHFYGVRVGHGAWVWGSRRVPDPAKKRYYGWKGDAIMTVFPRAGSHPSTLYPSTGIGECWTLQESYTMAGFRGVGRIGADFWPVHEKAVTYSGRSIAARYASWGQTGLGTSSLALLDPGPEGARLSIRIETVVEGAQEAEARIFIEKAMQAKKDALPAKELQEMLDRRARVFNAYRHAKLWYKASGWQERSALIFTKAGEVARAAATPAPAEPAKE